MLFHLNICGTARASEPIHVGLKLKFAAASSDAMTEEREKTLHPEDSKRVCALLCMLCFTLGDIHIHSFSCLQEACRSTVSSWNSIQH